MIAASDHLIILPIVLPLLAGAALLLVEERRRALKAWVTGTTTVALLGIALTLMRAAAGTAGAMTYRVGAWEVPVGIVLVLDRLSALMLVLTAVLALAALVFAAARWHRVGSYFHSLFLFLLVGLNGAFLTGDLFNLFVFLEVLLAASYGLALHGSGAMRVRAGLHYIAINVAGAMLLLIGISLLYGVTGTLNMADLAVRIPSLAGAERGLAHAGAAILGIALLVKSAMWPVGFWLVPTYTAASAPVAAIFAVMTKVGIYTILRLWLPLFASGDGLPMQLGGSWLMIGGIITIVFGTVGLMASQKLGHFAGHCVLISSGTLLTILGSGHGPAVGGALFYLVSSTLGIATLFLLIELIESGREAFADVLAVTREALEDEYDEFRSDSDVGLVIPGSLAFLGLSFVGCALLLAGLPPFSGFVGKFAILTTLLSVPGPASDPAIAPIAWTILALLLTSGLVTLVAASRLGIRALWAESDRVVPRMALLEVLPIAFLLLLCLGLSAGAGPVMRYMEDTSGYLRQPATYIDNVLDPTDGAQR